MNHSKTELSFFKILHSIQTQWIFRKSRSIILEKRTNGKINIPDKFPQKKNDMQLYILIDINTPPRKNYALLWEFERNHDSLRDRVVIGNIKEKIEVELSTIYIHYYKKKWNERETNMVSYLTLISELYLYCNRSFNWFRY